MITKVMTRCRRMLFRQPAAADGRGVGDPLADLCRKRDAFQRKLDLIKRETALPPAEGCWYPHNVLGNLDAIGETLTGERRDLLRLIGNRPVADIGGADGDLSFFIESLGVRDIHLFESSVLNCSRCAGARTLRAALRSDVIIHDVDIERQGMPPDMRFGLVFFLGTLYHLKNPLSILEYLSQRTEYCLVSTRVARYLPDSKTRIDCHPVAYLVGPDELNNDPSNYFIFSHTGLRRLCGRAGWDIIDWNTFDNRKNSTPSSLHNGERAFCLLRSRTAARQ